MWTTGVSAVHPMFFRPQDLCMVPGGISFGCGRRKFSHSPSPGDVRVVHRLSTGYPQVIPRLAVRFADPKITITQGIHRLSTSSPQVIPRVVHKLSTESESVSVVV